MNSRVEAKLTDLSGMNKAINGILQQAWERGRKYQEKLDERPKSKWLNGRCTNCGTKALYDIDYGVEVLVYYIEYSNFCPNCGRRMKNGT